MLILYSTNSFLAFSIAERFYKRRHYFWCAPVFDPRLESKLASTTLPPTSSPAELYERFSEDIARSDHHSPRIAQNRSGIVAGAEAQKRRGTISDAEYDEIVDVVGQAQLPDFRPVLFVAPFAQLKVYLRSVTVSRRAHPLSSEQIAENVPRRNFDVIEIPVRRVS